RGSDSTPLEVAFANIIPAAPAAADQPASPTRPSSDLLGSFADLSPNDQPWAVDVDWGDGSSHLTASLASQGSLGSQSHTYADNGAYTVTFKVTDEDGGVDTDKLQVKVANLNPTLTAAG